MKKILFTLLFVAAGLTCLADEYYIVGDATPWGWVTGDGRKPAQMTETSSGVYVWTGLLKRAEGFYICNSLNNWSGVGSSVPKAGGAAYNIADIGSDTYTSGDNKWNPVNTDWQNFTITLDTNNGTLSWEAGESFVADGDGYYQISNAQELNWFSIIVNNNQSAKAKLTADIDYTAYPKGFIGTNSKRFAGTFDGQEHTITIDINNNATCTGLFGVINGATIKNLIVEGKAESSAKLLGGLGGVSYGNCTIENIVVKTAIKFTGSGDATLGGIFGDMEAASTVKNCAFYGSVNAPNGQNVRGLASWCSGGVQFVNCIIAPTEVIAASGSDYANGSYTNNNCIKVAADDAGLASGEICYTMNGDQSNINWYQTLGTDDLPVPFSSHSQVFANGQLLCDGTSAGGDIVYSNSSTSVLPPHTDVDGWCSVCGKIIEDHITADAEGFYPIGSATDLNWFAGIVKEANQSAKAKLTSDIDYTAYSKGFIGLGNAFKGVFDGQGYTVTIDIENDAKIRGLFASINGATIKNLVVDGSIMSSFNNIGGLGGQTDGDNIVENVIVKTTINFTPGSGDASIGGFFPYINSGTVNFRNCAFYGSVKAGTATGNAGLVSWSSGSCLAENCLVAPAEIEANAFDDYARGKYSTENCYRVDLTDARLASGELCYLLNGSTCFNAAWTQTIGTDALPVPFTTQGFVNYITSAGYATLFIPTTDVTVPAGVNAYTGKVEGEILKLTLIKGAISKENAVVLKGEEGFYSFVPTTGATPAAQNDITAATTEMEAEDKYILAEGDEGVGFYKATGYIPAGKAYLEISGGSYVNGFTFFFEDENPTGINEPLSNSPLKDGDIYNLAGQRINKMQKGINIVKQGSAKANGKKVLF